MVPILVCNVQGFDKYGIWRIDAVPAPKLRDALSLKVIRLPSCLPARQSSHSIPAASLSSSITIPSLGK